MGNLIREAYFRNTNFYLFREQSKPRLFGLKMVSIIIKLFGLKQPVWRFYILERKLRRLLGITLLGRLLKDWRRSLRSSPG